MSYRLAFHPKMPSLVRVNANEEFKGINLFSNRKVPLITYNVRPATNNEIIISVQNHQISIQNTELRQRFNTACSLKVG